MPKKVQDKMHKTPWATDKPSVRSRLTGNSGYAFQDGTMRGAIAALVSLAIAFVATVVDIDPEQLAIVYAATGPALFVAFGWYDSRRK